MDYKHTFCSGAIGTPMGGMSIIRHMGRDIGVRLRHARKLRGMSQQKLAKSSGVQQASISQLETGESKSFRGTTLVSIAQTLKVNPEWLAEGKGTMDGSDPGLPSEALAVAREWLKLGPEARSDILKLIRTMVKTSAADTPHVADERVAAAYGRPGSKK